MAQLSSFSLAGALMFVEYTPLEIQKLKIALNTKKEISLNKTIEKKKIDLKYHDLDDDQKQLAQIISKMKLFKGLNERKVLDILKYPSLNRYNRGDVILDKKKHYKTNILYT